MINTSVSLFVAVEGPTIFSFTALSMSLSTFRLQRSTVWMGG